MNFKAFSRNQRNKIFWITDSFLLNAPKLILTPPPRRIPFSLKPLMKQEFDKMVQDKIIRKVGEPIPIANPLAILKQKGIIRIWFDSTEVNKSLLWRYYPLKTLEEITAGLKGNLVNGYFTKLDLKEGSRQLKISHPIKFFFIFTTPWERYYFLRSPFGIKIATNQIRFWSPQRCRSKVESGQIRVWSAKTEIFWSCAYFKRYYDWSR